CWTLGVGRWAFFSRRPNDRPDRNFHDLVRSCASAHFFPHAVPAVFCLDQGLVEEIRKIIDVSVCPKDHVTTASAIAAVRPAFRHKFFSSKTDGPAPALSSLCKNFYPIDEHGAFKDGNNEAYNAFVFSAIAAQLKCSSTRLRPAL